MQLEMKQLETVLSYRTLFFCTQSLHRSSQPPKLPLQGLQFCFPFPAALWGRKPRVMERCREPQAEPERSVQDAAMKGKGGSSLPLRPPGILGSILLRPSFPLPSGARRTSGWGARGKGTGLAAAAASASRAWWPAAAPGPGRTRRPGTRAAPSASRARRTPSLCAARVAGGLPGPGVGGLSPRRAAPGEDRPAHRDSVPSDKLPSSLGRRKSAGRETSSLARGGRLEFSDFFFFFPYQITDQFNAIPIFKSIFHETCLTLKYTKKNAQEYLRQSWKITERLVFAFSAKYIVAL